MSRLLVVHHSPTPTVEALTESVLAGTRDEAILGVDVVVHRALDVVTGDLDAIVDDVLHADGYLIGSTANFGYMSGALKHFFDSVFLRAGGALADDGSGAPGQGTTARRPFGLYLHGRYDTTGAVRSVLSIVAALGWRQAADVLEVIGDVGDEQRRSGYELGGTISALLAPDS